MKLTAKINFTVIFKEIIQSNASDSPELHSDVVSIPVSFVEGNN